MQSKTIEKLTIHQISLDHVKETKILNKKTLPYTKSSNIKFLLFYFFISYLFAFVS